MDILRMGIYVYGYTDLLNFETKVYEVKEASFNNETLYDIVISNTLKECSYNSKNKLSEMGNDGFRLVFTDSGAVLFKEKISRGYIYNSKKEQAIYSFFYKEIKNETVEDVVELSDPKLTFLNELKMKIQSRPIDIPIFKMNIEDEQEKTPFQIDLEKEINMRRSRATKRTRKIELKRKKRLGLYTLEDLKRRFSPL
jgi:hypothetical protein